MELLKVSQVAKKLGISPTAVYKKFRTCSELIQTHVHKEKGITYIDIEGFELVKNSMQKAHPEPVSPGSELVQSLQKELDRKQGIIESLIAQNEEQRKRTDTIIMKLTGDISNLQKSLEFKKPEPPKTTADKENAYSSASPSRRPDRAEVFTPENLDPLENLNFLQRFWIELTAPEKLRRYNS